MPTSTPWAARIASGSPELLGARSCDVETDDEAMADDDSVIRILRMWGRQISAAHSAPHEAGLPHYGHTSGEPIWIASRLPMPQHVSQPQCAADEPLLATTDICSAASDTARSS